MKKFMLLIVVLLLAGCASTPEPQVVRTVYIETVPVSRACSSIAGNCNAGASSSNGSSYLVNLRREYARPQKTCGGLTVSNYKEANVVDGVVLYRVIEKCQKGGHWDNGLCLQREISFEATKEKPYGGLVQMQIACNKDNSLPFCRQEPGRIAGEWDCLSKALIAIGKKDMGDATRFLPPEEEKK